MQILSLKNEVGLIFPNSRLAGVKNDLLERSGFNTTLSYFQDTLRVVFISRSDLDKINKNPSLFNKLNSVV